MNKLFCGKNYVYVLCFLGLEIPLLADASQRETIITNGEILYPHEVISPSSTSPVPAGAASAQMEGRTQTAASSVAVENVPYSTVADNPDAGDQQIRNLAENLGNDPLKMYEWVYNNIRTEFYPWAQRGAYLTFLDRAGNDMDQCALLGALLKAAGHAPIYKWSFVAIPLTAKSNNVIQANRVGVYEWLGVGDTVSAKKILTNYAVNEKANALEVPLMWIAVDLPGRGPTTFAPSLKNHEYGRSPSIDELSGYTWNGAALESGSGSTGSYSGAVNRTSLRAYLTARSVEASEAIKASATLHDLSGGELAKIRASIPAIFPPTIYEKVTAFPGGLGYPSSTRSLGGIPEAYCSKFTVSLGAVEKTILAPELLGLPLSVGFDVNGTSILRMNGEEISRGGLAGTSLMESIVLNYEQGMELYATGTPRRFQTIKSLARSDSIAIVYAFGRSVDRLRRRLTDEANREDAGGASSALDRLDVIGLQYLSQAYEIEVVGGSYLGHETVRSLCAGFVYLQDGRPVVDMGFNFAVHLPRSATVPDTASVYKSLGILQGGLEGTAIEQHSGQKSFGTATMFDYATTQGIGADYLQSISQLRGAGISGYDASTLGAGAINHIEAHLNTGGHAVLLHRNDINYSGTSLRGYFLVTPSYGGVGSHIGGASGGVSTAPVGNTKWARLWNKLERFVKKLFTKKAEVSSDPVDLATGAFYFDNIDLALGSGSGPSGLVFARHYSSARASSDPTGLGRGWTHNYHIQLGSRSAVEFDSLVVSYEEVVPLLLAVRHAQDSLAFEPFAARSWLMAAVSLTWAADQQIGSRVTVQMGSEGAEFIRRPDLSFVPASGAAIALQQSDDGAYELAYRHGNTIHFRATDGKFEWIKDRHGNLLTADYSGGKVSKVTDAYGRFLTFSYDGVGMLFKVSDSTGREVGYARSGGEFSFTDVEGKISKMQFDEDHRATKVIDARGRTVVENKYDFWGRVYQQHILGEATRTLQIGIAPGVGAEVDPTGKAVWTYFDARGRKSFVLDQANKLAQWHYDGADRLTAFVTPLGNISSYAYDQHHVLVGETNPAGHTRIIVPDAEHRPWKVKNFEGQETTFTYTDQHEIKTITAPGGIVSSFEYDDNGRVWKAHPAHYAADEFDTYAYDAIGYVDLVTRPADSYTDDQDFDDYSYNARGDLIEVIDRMDVRRTFTYNKRRQLTGVTLWEGSIARTSQTFYDDSGEVDYTLDAAGRKIDIDYDALGHLTEVKQGPTSSQNVTLRQVYNSRNLLQDLFVSYDGSERKTSYTYSDTHQVATIVDPLSRTVTLGYDDDQRTVSVKTPLANVTIDVLDARGLTDGVKDAEGQLVDYTYDKDGRTTELANRKNKSFTWTYDDAERIITATTPTGKTTKAVTNTRGLPATLTKPSSQLTTFGTYDAEGRLLTCTDGVGTTTYTYWPNGLPKAVTENSRTTSRSYDTLNRLTRYDDGEGNTITYEYHPSGELWKLNYPGSKTVTYTYDDSGRLFQVTDWANRTTTYTYWENGLLKRIDRPNGTSREQRYDAAGQLRYIRETRSGALFHFQELKYDLDGRITSSFLHPMPAVVTLPTDIFTYDNDNRLNTFNGEDATHDADGNMTSGPLPSGAFGTYGYDVRDRLVSAGGSGYRYNPDGLRVEITGAGAATFVVDPNAALSRTLIRVKNGVTTYYVYGLGLLYEDTGGATRTYHADQVGSTVALTDSAGTVTDRWTYAPYGAEFRITGTTDTPFRFNGELGVQTEPNGLLQMRARYYHPRLMRFVNADPIGFGGGLNWYAFAGNDPISRCDPFGLKDSKKTKVEIGALQPGEQWEDAPNSAGRDPNFLDKTVVFGANLGLGLLTGSREQDVGRQIAIEKLIGAMGLNPNDPTLQRIVAGSNAAALTGQMIAVARAGGPQPASATTAMARNPSGPVTTAAGAHTVFRRDPTTGQITHYTTYVPQTNPQNPNPWQVQLRMDAVGPSHFNKDTQQPVNTPHVHDPSVPGGVRPALPGEIPPIP